jgi:hypothetical protein
MHLIIAVFTFALVDDFLVRQSLMMAAQALIINNAGTQFNVLKSDYNDNVCAVGVVPLMNMSASAEYCAFHCQHQGALPNCGGFNYINVGSRCEFYSNSHSAFGLKRGCTYYKVRIFVKFASQFWVLRRLNVQI